MFELYRFYFRTLCELHPDLLHTDANRIFRVIHIEEAFGDFRKEVAEKRAAIRRNRKGRSSTILTTADGLEDNELTTKKKMLGG